MATTWWQCIAMRQLQQPAARPESLIAGGACTGRFSHLTHVWWGALFQGFKAALQRSPEATQRSPHTRVNHTHTHTHTQPSTDRPRPHTERATMMLQRSAVSARPLAARGTSSPLQTAMRARRSVVRRFHGGQDDDRPEMQQLPRRITDTKLTQQQLEEIYTKEAGNISPRTAEMRADLGSAVTDLSQVQSFDGPIPETVNGRLAALGFVMAIAEEWYTGRGLLQQVADHPLRTLVIGLLIGFASYAPVVRGYTRKEPFANYFLGLPWLPKIENWNGRVAMLGFVAMILTEAVTGVNTLQAWGMQPVAQAVGSLTVSGGGGVL